MASRVAFMRLGWGYAMLGPPIWVALLHSMDRSPEQTGLSPLLKGASAAAIVVSLGLPLLVRHSTALRTRLIPNVDAPPGAADETRRALEKRRKARAFEVHLVTWVLSLVAAAVPGMAGLMLGITGHDLGLSHALIGAAFVLTMLRFPRASA
jgi:hypothetical protein